VCTGCCSVVCYVVCAQLNNIKHETTTTSAHRPPTFTVRRCIKKFPDYFTQTANRWHYVNVVCCDWELSTSPLSVPSGFAVWTLGVAQH
jgi:hypothetical protein